MAISILPKFLTLKWNISRTIWRIEVGNGSFFCIFHALSFELNFFSSGGSLLVDNERQYVDISKALRTATLSYSTNKLNI